MVPGLRAVDIAILSTDWPIAAITYLPYTMHSRLAPLVDDIESQRTSLLAIVESHPIHVLNATPSDPDVWSPAQILDHLAIVEGNVTKLLAHRLARAKEAGLARETSTEPIRSALKAEYLTRKIIAPENVRPQVHPDAADALTRLKTSHLALRAMLGDADGYALSDVKARHQIFGELDMYEWLVFLPRHEQRHVAQFVRTIAAMTAHTIR